MTGKFTFICTFFLLSLSYRDQAAAAKLTLKEYLGQVKSQNEGFRSQQAMIRALWLKESEGALEFVPYLVGGASYLDDRKPAAGAGYPLQTIAENANLGVQTKLRTGTLLNLKYDSTWTQLSGPTPYGGLGTYSDSPSLTISQPLWKDFNGAFSKAYEEAITAGYKAQAALQRLQSAQIFFNAESAYWRVALLREIVKFDSDTLERTGKILKWNQKRVGMNVADRSDVLQAEAALKGRELQYQNDLENLRQASSQFNSLRSLHGDLVEEELASIDSITEKNAAEDLRRLGNRPDVTASIYNAQHEKAAARAAIEKYKPDVSLFGSAAFNGHDVDNTQAMSNSWKSETPTYMVGVKLSIPLEFGLLSDLEEGYNVAATAADSASWRARFELDQDWSDLQKKFKDAALRLKMAQELERLQEEKLSFERVRFNRGRTTSFQVLQFEDHYSEARATRLRVINEVITLRAYARLYNGDSL